MPRLYEICSGCGNNWMGCDCDNYHPPIRVPVDLLHLNREEVTLILSSLRIIGANRDVVKRMKNFIDNE